MSCCLTGLLRQYSLSAEICPSSLLATATAGHPAEGSRHMMAAAAAAAGAKQALAAAMARGQAGPASGRAGEPMSQPSAS